MSTRGRHAAIQRRRSWVLALLILAGSARAGIIAGIDPGVVDEFDAARLTIRVTGTNQAAKLDLKPLDEDFEVLTTQSATQYRSINGQVESWVEYQIMLRPRRAGDLTIPPIDVGSGATEPLNLRVRGIPDALRSAIERMVFFETEISENPVYVQAETVLTRRLYYSSGAQIYSDLPGMPDIEDAIVMPLGETTSTTTVRDGQRYGVIEQQFAILPEQSGNLTIPSISVTSSVRLQSNGRTRRSGIRVNTDPIVLEVMPIPAEYPADQPWLPATDLRIVDTFSPAQSLWNVGDPMSRTVRARISGNVSSAIPPLRPTLPEANFRSYPEPPLLEDVTDAASVAGIREEVYAIMPTAPGTVTLPPVEVTWWDVAAGQLRTARAPERSLTITGTPAQAPPAPDPLPDAAGEPPPDIDVRSTQAPWPGAAGWRIFGVLLIVALVMLVLASIAPFRRWLMAPSMAPPSLRARRRALEAASRSDDSIALQHRLLEYLCAYYQAPLAEATRCFRNAGHGALLDRLNARRYGRASGAEGVDGKAVLDAVGGLGRRRHDRPDDALPGLYS